VNVEDGLDAHVQPTLCAKKSLVGGVAKFIFE
jgi:hypothetical protein